MVNNLLLLSRNPESIHVSNNNKTNDLILNLTPENLTQHSRIVRTTCKGSTEYFKFMDILQFLAPGYNLIISPSAKKVYDVCSVYLSLFQANLCFKFAEVENFKNDMKKAIV